MGITVVGLGPGDSRLLTREAWEVLSQTPLLYVRTSWHPAVAELPAGVVVKSFDHLYDAADDFTTVYVQIVAQLLEQGRTAEVVYAVPGHPFVGEATVTALVPQAASAGIPVRIVEGLSFVEPMLSAVNQHAGWAVDGMDGVQVCDALDVLSQDYPRLHADRPVLVGQVYNQAVASDLKLALTVVYPDEHEVALIHGAGGTAEQVERLYLYEIDRSPHTNHLTSLYLPPLPHASDLTALAEAVATLRGPHGCPWDQEQTPQSMRADFIEETSELLDALDADDPDAVCEELGDVLLHVTMQAQMAAEEGLFTLSDVISGIHAKIVRRHPHVWGDVQAADSAEVLQNWAAIKAEEKIAKGVVATPSVLENIPHTLPALAQSQKIQGRVRKAGFDWDTIAGVYDKLDEEVAELQAAATPAERLLELGDVLFVVVNLGKWLGVEAEIALREANLRFSRRFRQVEELAQARGLVLSAMSEPELTALWKEAKAIVGTASNG